MRASFTASIVLFALLIPSRLLSGPNPQLKITIKGGSLTNPIEIFDHDMLTRFFFGAGPGNFVNGNGERFWAEPSFIVDWPQGAATEPSKELPAYDVEFLTSRPDPGTNTYRVTYVYNPATQQGFVYLPGKTDSRYHENTWLLLRGVEGQWFHAWGAWNSAAVPLLANAR